MKVSQLKKIINSIDLDLLSAIERMDYNRFILDNSKYITVLKVIERNENSLSPELEKINELINE